MNLVGTIGVKYDAENRQISTRDGSLPVQASYSYDGAGQRVIKSVSGGATTVYVYDALGKLISEKSNAATPPPCTTCYLSYDYLGSVRMATGNDTLTGNGLMTQSGAMITAGRNRWTCTASCNVQPIGNNPAPVDRVTGIGMGPNQVSACPNAKRAATQSAPAGTYARHCWCACSTQ